MDFKKIKDQLGDQLEKTKDLDEVAKCLNALNAIEGIEKTNADKRKSELDIDNLNCQKKAENKKFIVGVIAPFLTSIALIATVFVQILQTKNNYILQLQNKEDEQWKIFLDKITSPNINDDGTIPIFLKGFYVSTAYKDKACELTSTMYLPNLKSLDEFNNVFPDYYKTIDANNYENLVQLTLKLYDKYNSLYKKISDDRDTPPGSDAGMNKYYQNLVIDENRLLNNIALELKKACSGLRDIVNRINANSTGLNLNQAYFFKVNLNNINLRGAEIDDTSFDQVSLNGADLSDIKSFDHSDWDNTAWWQAKDLSKDLLKYLIDHYPYDKNQSYYSFSADDEAKYNAWVKKDNSRK